MAVPGRQGLYDPRNEHDSCGVGFVADIKGRKSHDIIERGLQILVNLDHRGAVGADPLVGDGAGCLIQMPDALLRDWALRNGLDLPPPGRYAVAMCFLPRDPAAREFAIGHVEHFSRAEGQRLVGWREVPTDTTGLGARVIETMPTIRQAIRAERKLTLSYVDVAGASTLRTIWPIALAFFDRSRNIVAWCEMRAAFRNFRTDRILTLETCPDRYPRRRLALLKEWRELEGISGRGGAADEI